MKLAAIQLETTLGDVAVNIALAERMANEAFSNGAKIVGLPEFFTGAIVPDPAAYNIVLPAQNAAIDMLQRVAKQHSGTIGGSMLLAADGEVYNRYILAEPDGTLHAHDKDLPTMWENAFYVGGNDDGVFETQIGCIGAAVCWELIRNQTLRRMAGRVQLAMTGTHWWTLPSNWPGFRKPFAAIGQYNRYLAEQAPVEFARRLGAPVLQASHCGALSGRFRLSPGADFGPSYDTHFVGATQIVAADGAVLVSRNTAAGPGIVYADVELEAHAPVLPADEKFWVPELPAFLHAYWHQQNVANRSAYRRHGRKRGLAAAETNKALT